MPLREGVFRPALSRADEARLRCRRTFRVTTIAFEFAGRRWTLPEPVAGPAEVVIDVEHVNTVPRPENWKLRRIEHHSPFAKTLFFLWREGLALTVRKLRLALLNRQLEAAAKLVVASGRTSDGQRCVALGWQHATTLDPMLFPADACAVVTDLAVTTVVDALVREVSASALRYGSAAEHSAHSGVPVPVEIRELMRRYGPPPRIRPQSESLANGGPTVSREH